MLLTLDPVPALLARVGAELSDAFQAGRSLRVSRAPGTLDVMGGSADYTGSLVCQATLGCAAAVALQARDDRQVQVFSFNLLDEHQPFTLRVPLEALAKSSTATLRREFAAPGRTWAGYLAGCLHQLQVRGWVDLSRPSVHGVNLAVLSAVPIGAGSSAAITVATMMNLVDHFALRDKLDPLQIALMCQAVENQIVGVPGSIAAPLTSLSGQPDSLLRLICQPHQIQPPLHVPQGMRFVGIHANLPHRRAPSAAGRCAAFMGHKIILEKMRDMGRAAGRTLAADPMNGYLANLDPDDYKKYFRPYLPSSLKGGEFLLRYGGTIDAAPIALDLHYPVQSAVDHHVLEAMRVRHFAQFIEQAGLLPPDSQQRGSLLDKAGHLMYASHLSFTRDAQLGSPECDLLVQLVRDRERAGLYGAKITGGGGAIAVLADVSPGSDAAIGEINAEYERQTGRKPEVLVRSSGGAWEVGTATTPSQA